MNRNVLYWVLPLVFPILVIGFLVATGHLTDGPQMVDDNQIYKMQIELEENGFFRALGVELCDRFMMRRLVPLYSVQKTVQSRIFAGNLVAWSVCTGLVGACAAGVLFYFFRLCRGTLLACLAFALITVVGEQSVVWWRMLHGEGIGMLMLSTALAVMVWGIRTRKLRYEIAFLFFITLATLSKESFILVIPAVLFLKIWLTAREQQLTLRVAAKRSWLSLICLPVVFISELAIIKFVFATTSFNYAGWNGFDAANFQSIVQQYAHITNALLLGGLGLLGWLLWTFRRVPERSESKPQKHRMHKMGKAPDGSWTQRAWASVLMAVLFCMLLTLPQLFLYMSTGMLNINAGHYGRYILPCMVGYAFVVAELIRLIQQASQGSRAIAIAIGLMLCVSLADKSVTAYQEAAGFANVSRTTDAWFEAIVENTDQDSPIVLAFINGMADSYSLQVALRVHYLLSRCYDRDNVYFSPIPPEPTLEKARLELVQADSRRHAKRMRPVGQMDRSRPPAAIMIINWGPCLERNQPTSFTLDQWMQKNGLEWFEPWKYRREVHPHGHITYFREPWALASGVQRGDHSRALRDASEVRFTDLVLEP